MSEWSAVRCQNCGGTVAAEPGKGLPKCLFCGSDAKSLIPFDPPESVEQPEQFLAFEVDADGAKDAFKTFSKSSFWYPGDLRNAKLQLKELLLPAWAWSGAVETHWTGLVRANSRSGKRPVGGQESTDFRQILIPASKTLTLRELAELGAYDEQGLADFDADAVGVPYELSEMTRSIAKQTAANEMERRHSAALAQRHSTTDIHASSLTSDLEGKPVLVPVYVGAYPYGDKSYRILVNGQSGQLVGEAPISWFKVVMVSLAVLFVIALLVLGITTCSGIGVLVAR